MNSNFITLEKAVISANTGADAIKRAPIVEEDTGVRCLRIGDISNDKPYSEWGFTNADEKVIEKFSLKKDDIIIARTGNTIGVVKYIDKDINSVYNNGLIRLKIDKSKFDPKYIYYNLSSKAFKDFVFAISGGTSTQPNMKINHALKFEINNFTLDEQKAIAKILSDLDEKIEINNKINKTLEEMAQAIFKQWFVDFEFPNEEGKPYKSSGGEMVESELGMIPKGWKVVKLHEIGNLTMGLSPKSESYNTDGEGTPLLNGAADFNDGLIKPQKYTTQETRVCRKNDLVFCIRATIGNITFADREYCLGRGVAALEPKKNLYVGLIYMNLLKSMEKLKAQATGSVILGLSKSDINDMKLILPNNDIVDEFSNIFNNIFDKKFILQLENDNLIKLRDTLLPKLISGEIRVPLDN